MVYVIDVESGKIFWILLVGNWVYFLMFISVNGLFVVLVNGMWIYCFDVENGWIFWDWWLSNVLGNGLVIF